MGSSSLWIGSLGLLWIHWRSKSLLPNCSNGWMNWWCPNRIALFPHQWICSVLWSSARLLILMHPMRQWWGADWVRSRRLWWMRDLLVWLSSCLPSHWGVECIIVHEKWLNQQDLSQRERERDREQGGRGQAIKVREREVFIHVCMSLICLFVRTGVNSYFLVFTFTLPSSKFQVPTSSSSSSALSFALFVFSEPFVSRLATRLVLFVPSCSLSESVMPRLHISVEPHTLQLFVIQ